MAEAKTLTETPLMKQYNAIKARYPGALLLFRVGDFYETFGQDAVAASKVLDIVLTKRGNGSASEIELAGFPHHALDTYLPKLVRAGHRVGHHRDVRERQPGTGDVHRAGQVGHRQPQVREQGCGELVGDRTHQVSTATPSRRNSGLETTSNSATAPRAFKVVSIFALTLSAVPTGTVDFVTTTR